MATTLPRLQTLPELAHALGDIPLSRIVTDPAPGTVTWEEAQRFAEHRPKPVCEWIDGTLVEKAMGMRASAIGAYLIALLVVFVIPRRLGTVTGEAGMFHVNDDGYRGPDVSFFSVERMAQMPMPRPGIYTVAPDLAVEVLSPTNTRREMARKRDEYFTAGVRLLWIVDPETQTVSVWTDANTSTLLTVTDTLTGGDVLPGFTVAIAELFAIDA